MKWLYGIFLALFMGGMFWTGYSEAWTVASLEWQPYAGETALGGGTAINTLRETLKKGFTHE